MDRTGASKPADETVRVPGVRGNRWLLLIHQIPPEPGSFRVRIWRRLQNLGAVAVKNSVYALPNTERAREDFEWLLREIVEGGGEGSVCEVTFLDGLGNEKVEALFRASRAADYAQIERDARALLESLPRGERARRGRAAELQPRVKQLRKRLTSVAAIDHFGAEGKAAAESALAQLEGRLASGRGSDARAGGARAALSGVTGRTWVTRRNVHVDRIASGWLIRRFIDPKARFKFVASDRYRPRSGELRFDMFEAEFTHEGDLCTFEVLLEAAQLRDPAFRRIAEVVHDIDLRDERYGCEETPGIARVIAGIARAHARDSDRLERGAAVLDDLYASYRKRA